MAVTRGVIGLWLLVSSAAAAQSAPPDRSAGAARKAAETITERDVMARVGIIADDSMGGRDTPSPGLETTARWIAQEFQRLGLKPAGDSGGFIQRYPINVAYPDPDSSFVAFSSTTGQRFTLQLGRDIFAVNGAPPGTLTQAPLIMLGGALDSAAIAGASLEDKLVIWVADWSRGLERSVTRTAFGLMGRGARGVVAVVNNDSLLSMLQGSRQEPIVRFGPPSAEGGLRPGNGRFLAVVSERTVDAAVPGVSAQFAEVRASPTPVIQDLPEWQATMIGKVAAPRLVGAPNVVGILPGSDPTFRDEYIVLSAHMDHVGSRCRGAGGADHVCNGADDDGSGSVGIIELAEAFAQRGARPKRSLVFLTVSAEERGLWGSRYFASHPPVDIASIVADLNMDMIGRNWKDTVVAIGKQHSDLGATVDRIAAAHQELGLTVVDDLWPEENLYGRSDHYNFAVKGVPILFFTSGLHADYHAVTDSPEKIDGEKEARILRLVFHLAREIGNQAARPQWNPESYNKIVRITP